MNRFAGIILIFISAASFGTLAIFGHFAYADGMDTITVIFLRFSIAAGLLLTLMFIRREPLPRGQTLYKLIGMGAIGYMGQSFAYLSAIKYASAGLVALLLYLYPLFVTLLSVSLLKEKLTKTKIIALGLAVFGAALTARPNGGSWLGILLALSAALIYSIYIIVGTDVMKHVSAIQSSAVIFASAGMTSLLILLFNGAHMPSTSMGWLAICGMVLLATVIPVVTFLMGLERIGPSNASMLSTIEPIVTVLLAAIIFGEQLALISMVGGILILASAILLTHSEIEKRKNTV